MDEPTGTRIREGAAGAIDLVDPDVAEQTIHQVPPAPVALQGEAPRPRLESWLVAAVFGLFYGLVGYFVITDGRIVTFDAVHLLNEAYMTWWNSPPKLAAITLQSAPMGSLSFLPLALVKPLATSLVAMPVLTALAGGAMMALVNSILYRCGLALGVRIGLLVLFGLNPMLVYYAGNGEPVLPGMACAAIGLLSLVSWAQTRGTRHLTAAGLAIAFAMMFDYGYALWALGFVIAIMIVGPGASSGNPRLNGHGDGRGNRGDRMRSSLLVFMTPIVYALMLWILINTLILGSPFGWLTAQTGMIPVNTTGVLQAVTASPSSALGDLLDVVLGVTPLALVAVFLLTLTGFLKGDRLSWGLFLILLLAASVPVIRVLVADQADLMLLSVGLPLALLALTAVAWSVHAGDGLGIFALVAMVVGLIATIPLGWDAMQNYRYQDQAQAFTRFVESGESQEGTKSVGGYTVGIDPEVAMARHINEQLPQVKNSILVDENYSYGPMLLSGRPQIFADRADRGESLWESLVLDPFGRVDYMLVTTGRAGDQLRKAYPRMVAGGEPGLTPVFRTARYVLISVSATRPAEVGGSGNVNGPTTVQPGPQSTPRPFTPVTPATVDSSAASTDSSATVEATPTAPTTTPAPAPSTSPSSVTPSGSSSAPILEGE